MGHGGFVIFNMMAVGIKLHFECILNASVRPLANVEKFKMYISWFCLHELNNLHDVLSTFRSKLFKLND